MASHNHLSHPVRMVSRLYIGGGKPYWARGDEWSGRRPSVSNSSGSLGVPHSFSGNSMVCYNCQKTGHINYVGPNVKVKINQIRFQQRPMLTLKLEGR